MNDDEQLALELAQKIISRWKGEGRPERSVLIEALDRVLPVAKESAGGGDIDRDRVLRELEARNSTWIGRWKDIVDNRDHEDWLTAERKQDWRYWQRYREYLEKDLPQDSVDSLDDVTDRIVGLLEDPRRAGAWDRRGLVVGHVQSGKTANYTGLICKAADSGYRLIVVLAGMHKNLRTQTQIRLDEGFLGYETRPITERRGAGVRIVGVGRIDSSLAPDYVTTRDDNGDFQKSRADAMGLTPSDKPILFVVKKNARVLRNLISWVEERVARSHDAGTGHPLVEDLPLLLIDDEADHASVDTGVQPRDENGQPDPDYEPKAINRSIRRLVHLFEKSAYVGYTATPFANIFIDPPGTTAEEGEDLYPRSFIVNLPTPSNYAGPTRVFGLRRSLGEVDDDPVEQPLPIVRPVSDHAKTLSLREREGWMPPLHRNGHRPLFDGMDELPPSLKEAVQAFLLATAIRRIRNGRAIHNSMLVHVTRFTSVQRAVRQQLLEYVTDVRRRLKWGEGAGGAGGVLGQLEALYRDDFVPCSAQVAQITGEGNGYLPAWTEVKGELALVAEDMKDPREINGSAGDVLDYDDHKRTGLTVIAVGGDKLARGLTLEGLTVSYFLRASRMYDTLMQMGRWFGYRPGYLDVCRLYTTDDLIEWFEHITAASEELRQEFDHMAAVGGTPEDYGLKVRSHPLLMVTSRVKMRDSRELQLTFAGSSSETVVLHRDPEILVSNLHAVERLLTAAGEPTEKAPERARPNGRSHTWAAACLWSEVSSDLVVEFLRDYQTHDKAFKVDSRLLADYVAQQTRRGELTEWTVAVLGDPAGSRLADLAGNSISLMQRSPRVTPTDPLERQIQDGRYPIRRLLSGRDEAIDLDLNAYSAALEITREEATPDPERNDGREPTSPSGPSIRGVRGLGDAKWDVPPSPERGLLLIYPLTPDQVSPEFDRPVIGFGVSFPASRNASSVTYRVNNVYWEQEQGE